MKRIETIVESCEDCRFCQKFYRISDDRECAFICEKTQRVIEMGNHIDPNLIYKPHILPEFCPLEAYKEAEKPEAQPVTAPCYIGQSKVDEKAPSTVILPGLPGLEWMTENLSGFGGTEVDGRWYYTYNEAVAAVKQLGNGWRLMTRGEAVDLAALGSIWQEGGPHGLPGRLFGGGLFLEAAGLRNRETGALAYVGTEGNVWCSSSYYAGYHSAGYLFFRAGDVRPLDGTSRAYGFAVRCVRNVK
ncbi:hypothetical protein [Alistipes sp.]|uniref:hypothetical protein n=1 Tax=Alistipes sp. TaxID=1872444 RepID=UPI003527AD2F